MQEMVILDVILIYIGEKYPTSKEIWRFSNTALENGVEKEKIIEYMKEEIREKFNTCKTIIVIEKGKVIDVL